MGLRERTPNVRRHVIRAFHRVHKQRVAVWYQAIEKSFHVD